MRIVSVARLRRARAPEPPGRSGPLPRPAVRLLSNIQILRGVAAVMVLIYHIMNELRDRGFPGDFTYLDAGTGGVDIFFVVSGFIMVYSTAPAFAKRGAGPLFLLRRAVRLVPLYYIITTIFVLAMLHSARHTGLPAVTWKWFASSYAFLFYPHAPDDDFPLYTQGWTLNFEMFFYLCFSVALVWRRGRAVAGLSVGFLVLTALGLAVALPWPVDRWSNTNIVQFVLGMWLAEAHLRGYRLRSRPALALAAAGFLFIYVTEPSVDSWLPYRGFVWGPPALAIVAAAALHEPRTRGPVRASLEALGDASYSLYLVHFAFFVGLGHLVEPHVEIASLPPLAYAVVLFVGAVALAFATYYLIERPITRALDRHLALSRRWRAVVTSPAKV